MVLRRKVHKLFDMLKCSKWQTIIDKNGYPKHLVLKDAYLTPSQLRDIKTLESDLRGMFILLKQHIDDCSVS